MLTLASGLASAGHQVTIIAPDFSPRPPFPIGAGARLRILGTGRRLPLAIRKVVYYLRLAISATADSDVCLVAYFLTVYAAAASALVHRCRVLHIVMAYEPVTHGTLAEASAWSRWVRRLLAIGSYRLPVERIYVTRWLARACGEPDGRVRDVGVTWEKGLFHSPQARPPTPVRIGVIGRRGPVKGYTDFLAAVRGGLGSSSPIVTAVVAVDVDELPEGVPVERHGPLDEAGMADFYRSCHIFVFPSLSEGFPAPPLEAMASGCAVVATRSGGVEDYATDGVDALLVPPGDPERLREAVRRLVDDPRLREELAAAGLRTSGRFTKDRAIEGIRVLVESPKAP